MKKKRLKDYLVFVREVHVQPVAVRAIGKTEAIRKVRDGEGIYDKYAMEYSHTLDPDIWTVELEAKR